MSQIDKSKLKTANGISLTKGLFLGLAAGWCENASDLEQGQSEIDDPV